MSRLMRDGTVEPVWRNHILRRYYERGQGIIHFLCSADHDQDWQPYPVDSYSAINDDYTYIHIAPFFIFLVFSAIFLFFDVFLTKYNARGIYICIIL